MDVFLVSGSFEERSLYAGEILDNQDCHIILCSMQYIEYVVDTLKYVKEHEFDILVHWLNPGYSDQGENWDRLGLVNQFLDAPSAVAIRSGKAPPSGRVQELREFIYGWAAYRNLIYKC